MSQRSRRARSAGFVAQAAPPAGDTWQRMAMALQVQTTVTHLRTLMPALVTFELLDEVARRLRRKHRLG